MRIFKSCASDECTCFNMVGKQKFLGQNPRSKRMSILVRIFSETLSFKRNNMSCLCFFLHKNINLWSTSGLSHQAEYEVEDCKHKVDLNLGSWTLILNRAHCVSSEHKITKFHEVSDFFRLKCESLTRRFTLWSQNCAASPFSSHFPYFGRNNIFIMKKEKQVWQLFPRFKIFS